MKGPIGTIPIMITTGRDGSCMKAIGIMKIMGATAVTTTTTTTTKDGNGAALGVKAEPRLIV